MLLESQRMLRQGGDGKVGRTPTKEKSDFSLAFVVHWHKDMLACSGDEDATRAIVQFLKENDQSMSVRDLLGKAYKSLLVSVVSVKNHLTTA